MNQRAPELVKREFGIKTRRFLRNLRVFSFESIFYQSVAFLSEKTTPNA